MVLDAKYIGFIIKPIHYLEISATRYNQKIEEFVFDFLYRYIFLTNYLGLLDMLDLPIESGG